MMHLIRQLSKSLLITYTTHESGTAAGSNHLHKPKKIDGRTSGFHRSIGLYFAVDLSSLRYGDGGLPCDTSPTVGLILDPNFFLLRDYPKKK